MIDGKDYTSDEIIKDVDIEIKELIKLINKIDGVETVNSCFGHHKTPCQIWLRIKDIDTANKFYHKYIYSNSLWDLMLTHTELDERKGELYFVLQSQYKDYPTVNLMVDTLTSTFKGYTNEFELKGDAKMTSNIIIGKALQEEYNKQIVEELRKMKAEFEEIKGLKDNPYNNETEYCDCVSMRELRKLFDKHIIKLKGDSNETNN